MRRVFQFFGFLILGVALLAGCKTSTSPNSNTSNNNSNNNNTTSGMTATVNGKAWKSDAVGGFRYAPTPTPNLQFEGWTNQPFNQVPFNVSPAITRPGTYPLVTSVSSLTEQSAEVSFNTDTSTYSDQVSGSMTITVLTSTNVQGTFHFTAVGAPHEDTITVTNGQFNVPLR